MITMPSSTRRSFKHVFFMALLIVSTVQAKQRHGLWGSLKDTIEPIKQPVEDSICSKYRQLSDKGRFVAGACVGFGATRFAISSESINATLSRFVWVGTQNMYWCAAIKSCAFLFSPLDAIRIFGYVIFLQQLSRVSECVLAIATVFNMQFI